MRKIQFLTLIFCQLIVAAQKPNSQQDSLDIMIGQMIMIGIGDFNTVKGSLPIFQEIAEGKAGGVVIYEKNILPKKPKSELALLVRTLQKDTSIPLFVSIDEEGGWVNRMKPKYGFPKSVSAEYLGKINELDSTRFYANSTAKMLSDFGINMNYAPVVDLNINPKSPAIGGLKRSYSSSAKEVAAQAQVVINEHSRSDVVSVLKHFPGHGSSKTDTHLGITDVSASWRFEEVYPYSTLLDSGVVQAIMTAHIINTSLDESKLPATLSKKIVTGILREFLGYEGLIISDDMQMGAINNEYGMKDAIMMSINAGVDMLMFANNVEDYNLVTASEIHQIIKSLVQEGKVSPERIKSSYLRIMKVKDHFGLLESDYLQNLMIRLARQR